MLDFSWLPFHAPSSTLEILGTYACLQSLLCYLTSRSKRRGQQLERVGTVEKLFVFPIKSIRGLEVTQGQVTRIGFLADGIRDRTYVVVDQNGKNWDMRTLPKMAQISVETKNDNLLIGAPNMDLLELSKQIDSHVASESLHNTDLFGCSLSAVDCGNKCNEWFSKFKGETGNRLLYSSPDLEHRRPHTSHLAKLGLYTRTNDELAFQSTSGYLICGKASLDDLNKKLETPMSYGNFRPNIVVDGSEPYDEDDWAEIFIGRNHFTALGGAVRCAITTIHPETGARYERSEPLTTLRKYRTQCEMGSTGPCFGIHVSPDTEGDISIGDAVYVLRKSLARDFMF